MLEVLKDGKQKSTLRKPKRDIIIKIAYDKETVEGNKRTIERTYKQVNLTKKINATAKLVKENSAQEKLKELEEILQREGKK